MDEIDGVMTIFEMRGSREVGYLDSCWLPWGGGTVATRRKGEGGGGLGRRSI